MGMQAFTKRTYELFRTGRICVLKEIAGPTSTINHPVLGRTHNKAASTDMLKGLC